MLPFTIILAVAAVALALALRPAPAVGLLIASCLLYPEYLRIPMGPAQMSVPRLVAMAIVATCLMRGVRFRLIAADWAVLVGWLWVVVTFAINYGAAVIGNRIGYMLDTGLMYFAGRYAIRAAADFRDARPWLILSAVVLGGLGMYESVTGNVPYGRMLADFGAGETWGFGVQGQEIRHGLYRARGSCSHPITFGVVMAALVALIWSVRGKPARGVLTAAGLAGGLAGVFSSMSSGPATALVMFVALAAFELRPSLIRPALCAVAGLCVVVDAVSSRRFWFVLTEQIALDGTTGWYRSRLLEYAIEKLPEYWVKGYAGDNMMVGWGPAIDGRGFVDMVNHYLLIAVQTGLVGMFLALLPIALGVRHCVGVYRRGTPQDRHYAFAIGASVIALVLTSLSVSYFGASLVLLWLMTGLMFAQPSAVPASAGATFGKADVRRARAGGRTAATPSPGPTPRPEAVAVSSEEADGVAESWRRSLYRPARPPAGGVSGPVPPSGRKDGP